MTTADGTVYRSCLFEALAAEKNEETLYSEQNLKLLENGQIVIIAGEKRFSLLGFEIR